MAVAKVPSTFTPEARKLLFEELFQKLKQKYNVNLVGLTLSLSENEDDNDEDMNEEFRNYLFPQTMRLTPSEYNDYLAHIGSFHHLREQKLVMETFWSWKNVPESEMFSSIKM
jgi:hypothetical protein